MATSSSSPPPDGGDEQPSKTKRSRGGALLKFGLSIGLSAFFLWLAVRALGGCPDGLSCVDGACVAPGQDPTECAAAAESCPSCVAWNDLPGQLANVSVWALIAFSLMYGAVHFIRIWRWYYMLRPLGLRQFVPALNAGAIGLAAIVIVPLRLGELVRPYLISRDTRIKMSSALGTAVVERVVDGLVVTGMLFVTLAVLPKSGEQPAVVWTTATIAAAIFVSASLVLAFAWWKRAATLRFLARIGNRISAGLTRKVLGLLEGFLDGVATLAGGRSNLGWFLFTTVLYWAFNGASMVYLANAFGLELGYFEGLAVMAILVIGIMVPGAPGHIGTFEFFLQAGLSLFVAIGEAPMQVVAYIATLHILQFLVQVVIGAPFFLVSGVSIRRAIEAGAEEATEPPH